MKHKATSLFLGLCLALMAIVASPAQARSTTGFSAFHVEVQGTTTTNAYLCLGESYGQVINDCASQVNLEFNLPVDNQTNHTVTIQNDWSGSATQSTFYCQLYSYSGSSSEYNYGGQINFTGPVQTQSLTVYTPENWSIQLICFNVPNGGGIANINWNP